MTFRRFAHFDTAIPYDGIDSDQEFQIGGQGVSSALVEILRSLGNKPDRPEFEGDHGWTFDVLTSRRRYYFQVQHGEQVALMTDVVAS